MIKKIWILMVATAMFHQAQAQVEPKTIKSAKDFIKQQEEVDPNLRPKKQPLQIQKGSIKRSSTNCTNKKSANKKKKLRK